MRMLKLSMGILFCLVVITCGSATKKKPKLNREILGEEMQFGRDAASFELWNEAIFRWEKVVHEDPEHVQAINNLAVAYESVGNYDKAKDLYKTALEIDEDSRAIRKNYKRFLNFYKKHQRQLQREEKQKQRLDGDAEQEKDEEKEKEDQE